MSRSHERWRGCTTRSLVRTATPPREARAPSRPKRDPSVCTLENPESGCHVINTMVGLVHQARSSDEVQQLLLQVEVARRQVTGGDQVLRKLVAEVAERGDEAAADFLLALALTTPQSGVRAAAEQALSDLEQRGVCPQSPAIQALCCPRFYKAYATRIDQVPEQQQVVFSWEMEGGKVQALLFLIDHAEMLGALKSMFLTLNCTKARFQSRLVDDARRLGVELREVPFAEAKRLLQRALVASRKHKVRLPPQWDLHWALVQRRLFNARRAPE